MDGEKKAKLALFISRNVIAETNRMLNQWHGLPARDESGVEVESVGTTGDYIYPARDEQGCSSELPRVMVLPKAYDLGEQMVQTHVFPWRTMRDMVRCGYHRELERAVAIVKKLHGEKFPRVMTTFNNLKMQEESLLLLIQTSKADELVSLAQGAIDDPKAKKILGDQRLIRFVENQISLAEKNPDPELKAYLVEHLRLLLKKLKLG